MYLKEIQLYMSRAYGPGSYDAAYEKQGRDYPLPTCAGPRIATWRSFCAWLRPGNVQVAALITHRFPLDEAPRPIRRFSIRPRAAWRCCCVSGGGRARCLRAAAQSRILRRRACQRSGKDCGVALVGAGNLARWAHLPNLKKLPGVTLRAVHSASGARGKSYAMRFGAAYCATDYQRDSRRSARSTPC